MKLLFENRSDLVGISSGAGFELNKPDITQEAVLCGDSDFDSNGVSIYGSVIQDGGVYRMWHQAWSGDWDGNDTCHVACVESDDGIHWRKPAYGVFNYKGNKANHLVNLPFHSPSIIIDPTATSDKRYRAIGYTNPNMMKADYGEPVKRSGYFTAYSSDGLNWTLDRLEPVWEGEDVISAAYHPQQDKIVVLLKRTGTTGRIWRRRFYQTEWKSGSVSESVSALFPDEFDDIRAREKGFISADYYGLGIMPSQKETVGFLWNFLHLNPLAVSKPLYATYGWIGRVDLSIVYQLEEGGKWHHVAGRPDWVSANNAPEWARGAMYTASSPIDVGNETRLYFTGTPDYHGWTGENVDYITYIKENKLAKIGFISWKKDRIIGIKSILSERVLLKLNSQAGMKLLLNYSCEKSGCIKARLLDGDSKEIEGFGFDAFVPLDGDSLCSELRWKNSAPIPAAAHLELDINKAVVYAYDAVME